MAREQSGTDPNAGILGTPLGREASAWRTMSRALGLTIRSGAKKAQDDGAIHEDALSTKVDKDRRRRFKELEAHTPDYGQRVAGRLAGMFDDAAASPTPCSSKGWPGNETPIKLEKSSSFGIDFGDGPHSTQCIFDSPGATPKSQDATLKGNRLSALRREATPIIETSREPSVAALAEHWQGAKIHGLTSPCDVTAQGSAGTPKGNRLSALRRKPAPSQARGEPEPSVGAVPSSATPAASSVAGVKPLQEKPLERSAWECRSSPETGGADEEGLKHWFKDGFKEGLSKVERCRCQTPWGGPCKSVLCLTKESQVREPWVHGRIGASVYACQ